MQTRGAARREGEAAAAEAVAAAAVAAQHEALVELLGGSPLALEAALAAIGPPGSPPLLAALAHNRHALLGEVLARASGADDWEPAMDESEAAMEFFEPCRVWLDLVPPLVRAYGESPDALAGMAAGLEDENSYEEYRTFDSIVGLGHAGAVTALLGAYRRAGLAHEALAAREHYALSIAASSYKRTSPPCCWRSTASQVATPCWPRWRRSTMACCGTLATSATRRWWRCWRPPTGRPDAPRFEALARFSILARFSRVSCTSSFLL
jgi:hypothetical protein